jgi:hypothetical protein
VDDDSYFLWADNNELLIFQKLYNNVSSLKRSWIVKTSNFKASENLSFTLNHKNIIGDLTGEESLWLIVGSGYEDDLAVPVFYKLEHDLNKAIASNISVETINNKIEIFKAPKLWMYHKSEPISCDQKTGTSIFVPLGGVPPYKFKIDSNSGDYNDSYTLLSKYEPLMLYLKPDKYNIHLTDSYGEIWTSTMYINNNLLDEIEIPNTVSLESGKTVLLDASIDEFGVDYLWHTPSGKIETGSEIEISESGLYEVEISKGNCKAWYTITVQSLNKNIESLSVYPNPTANGFYQISATLNQPEKYQLKITDNLGRIISLDNFDDSQYIHHKGKLDTPGIYLISLITKNEVETRKLIVVDE